MNVSEHFTHPGDSGTFPAWTLRWFVAAFVVLFALTHAPINFVMSWYDRFFDMLAVSGYITGTVRESLAAHKDSIIAEIIVPVRTALFFISLIIVGAPLVQDIRRHIRDRISVYTDRSLYLRTAVIFAFLCVLVFPSQLGLGGWMYARMSLEPFSFNDGKLWFYQRLLMPTLAYYLQLKGPLLYFFFSLGVTFLLFLLVQLFFAVRGITVSGLEIASIGTSSFLMSQLIIPGYTEQLALVFLLLLFIVPTGSMGRMSLVVLSLLAHEISIVPLAFIALLYFTSRERWMLAVIVVFYCFFWITSYGGDIAQLLSVRNVYGKSGSAWAMEYPLRLLSGILLSNKVLWVLIIAAMVTFREHRLMIGGMTLIAIGFTIIGVDTSRLMGFSVIALLVSVAAMRPVMSASSRGYAALLIANIIVPTFFIGTNIGIALVNGFISIGGTTIVVNGLYQILYLGVMAR